MYHQHLSLAFFYISDSQESGEEMKSPPVFNNRMDPTQRLGDDGPPEGWEEQVQGLLSQTFPEHFQGAIPFVTLKKVEFQDMLL